MAVKKEFNSKLYALIAFLLMASILATITVLTYKSKYNGFDPEKVALAYTQSIVERGDGYNAYKNAIISKNYKYGDYIREYYMYPVIYSSCDYKPGDSRDELTGYNDEKFMSEKSANDTGELKGKVIDTMYPYYVQLIEENNGWDNYDVIFTEYFKKLTEVREEVFGDKYMTDEIMFTALEANVATYGDSLTGTEEEYDQNTNIKLSDKMIGVYEENFGEDYKFTYKVTSTKTIDDLKSYKADLDNDVLETYGISKDDISEAKICTVKVTVDDDVFAEEEITVVKIKSTWYVDNLSTDTSAFYVK